MLRMAETMLMTWICVCGVAMMTMLRVMRPRGVVLWVGYQK
jgi:hypothetical protein